MNLSANARPSQGGSHPWGVGPVAVPTAAVVGSPINHSLSPVLHRQAYQLLGHPWTQAAYGAYEVTAEQLEHFLALTLRGPGEPASWMGLSLTMPLKEEAVRLADHVSSGAALVGAANTLIVRRDGRSLPRLQAHNTDVPGLVQALAVDGVQRLQRPVILGGGATACSALAAVSQLGANQVDLHVRTPLRAQHALEVAERLGIAVRLQSWGLPLLASLPDAVIVTTPGGSTDALVAHLSTSSQPLPVLFDVAYHPWPTRLAQWWKDHGGTVLNGLDLLVQQAVDQVRLMTGVDPLPLPREQMVAPMRQAGLNRLAGIA